MFIYFYNKIQDSSILPTDESGCLDPAMEEYLHWKSAFICAVYVQGYINAKMYRSAIFQSNHFDVLSTWQPHCIHLPL